MDRLDARAAAAARHARRLPAACALALLAYGGGFALYRYRSDHVAAYGDHVVVADHQAFGRTLYLLFWPALRMQQAVTGRQVLDVDQARAAGVVGFTDP